VKKVIPMLMVIAVIAGFAYYYITVKAGEEEESSDYLSDRRMLEIAQSPSELVDLISSVKKSPDQVMKTYAVLRKMIYGGEYSKEERINLISMQRYLLNSDLLEKNPKEYQILEIEAELEKWKEAKLKLIGSDQLDPVVHAHRNDTVFIKVVYYTNDPDPQSDIYANYALQKNAFNQWEILGWEAIDKFNIVK